MIFALVQIPRRPQRSRMGAVEAALGAEPMCTAVQSLPSERRLKETAGGGGLHLFDNRETVEAWLNDERPARTASLLGARPTPTRRDRRGALDAAADDPRADREPAEAPA